MPDRSPDAARDLFEQLLDLPEAEREARLRELAEGDRQLEERVRRLLEAHARATEFDSVIPTPPDISLPDPEHIGPYRILEKLGEGGMGVVYLGEQKKPVRRRVAIKIVRPGMASAEVINRFNAERQALALMSHPGISRILDAGATENGLPYFVMEYVPGVPLISYCDEHRLNLRQRVSLVRSICLAVQHAHQKGVIHRDLKPSNILVVEEDDVPVPKIIDFGIAKAMSQPLTDGTLHTRIGKLIGTPDYMSPEQCNSGSVDVDTRSDVYSLGVLLYQLLSSRLPYDFDRSKDNEVTILKRIVDEDPPPPSRRARDATVEDAAKRGLGDAYSLERRIRGELDWIVGRALERDRNRRYASAQELADDLGRFLDNEAVVAGPPSIGYRAGKFIRRHALGVSLMASIFLLVTGFAAALAWQLEQTRIERDRANREAYNAEQVTTILGDIFKAVHPDERSAQELSAISLLRQGLERINTDDTLSPLVRYRLLFVIGDAFKNLGYDSDAAVVLEQALAITTHPEFTDQRSAIMLRSRLAAALQQSGQVDRAITILEEAEALVEAEGLEGSPEWVSVQNALAVHDLYVGNFDEAIASLTRVLALYEETRGAGHERTLSTKYNLSLAYNQTGQTAKAKRTLEEVIATARETHGDVHSVIADAQMILANIARKEGDLETARKLYQDSLRIIETLHNQDTGQAMVALIGLGLSYRDTPRGIELMQDAYRRCMTAFGEDGHLTLVAAANLADFLAVADRYAEALPSAEHAYTGFNSRFGNTHPSTQEIAYTFARVQAGLGNHDKAREALAVALANPDFVSKFQADRNFDNIRNHPDFRELHAISTAQ